MIDMTQDNEAFWLKAYQEYFPDLVGVGPLIPRFNTAFHQDAADRFVYLGNNTFISVKEVHGSILRPDCLPLEIEEAENSRKEMPGWIKRRLIVDFIAFAWPEDDFCVILPWYPLQRAWQQQRQVWTAECPRWRVGESVSLLVPATRVQSAMARSSLVRVVSERREGLRKLLEEGVAAA